ncbi:hypothetical protein A3H22_04280 [Candidatus Peribacteria bacterium RIFCSPLOWO2_12_FULL_55_15]|nr:MAG: hypothetical protein A3D12_01740 [Candidatus Peribacteria bacterium RIFCSPHIGHO2_02_FULL_55_24]OGJ64307.1 MAG: hypothetical protein A3E47_03095 [Candidatus Peribacteria bacterium RIFCSPHIGHO2_12_FULL_54_10]OGJ67343.1 MAG: hypothetical protein A2947_04235 [Candidatus Peribacteria bacterium RIFCSPLOWO2_01_FULL_54_110]OGJ68743.1 MAG: hypothetical protein A3H90_00325 [Candidatus Peribacteria bacterium RIFCSPLOWO2_02_FULL_55_36]OGJ71239.1 MAG: hypothetical protein A3H22_04280 [Candidatus Per
MTSLLFSLWLSALLSFTSLLVILFRVSPLQAPLHALPAFYLSLLLSVSSISMILAYILWKRFGPAAKNDTIIFRIAFREGVFLGLSTLLLLSLLLFQILTWWITLLVLTVFVLVEIALHV